MLFTNAKQATVQLHPSQATLDEATRGLRMIIEGLSLTAEGKMFLAGSPQTPLQVKVQERLQDLETAQARLLEALRCLTEAADLLQSLSPSKPIMRVKIEAK